MTNAITFLHENDFVHRDIKPENILLDENNNIKLCDFGWCVSLHQNEKRTTFCGTFEYMAPEMVCEENYDTGVDISASDNILILQTCSYKEEYSKYNKKYLLVISRRVDK